VLICVRSFSFSYPSLMPALGVGAVAGSHGLHVPAVAGLVRNVHQRPGTRILHRYTHSCYSCSVLILLVFYARCAFVSSESTIKTKFERLRIEKRTRVCCSTNLAPSNSQTFLFPVRLHRQAGKWGDAFARNHPERRPSAAQQHVGRVEVHGLQGMSCSVVLMREEERIRF